MNRQLVKRSLGLLMTAMLVAPQATPAYANLWDSMSQFQKPNLNYGPVEFHPYYNFSETYDSNIFLNPKGSRAGQNANNNTAGPVLGSWITSNNLGVNVNAPITEMHKFNLGYDFNWFAFSKDPITNNYVAQDVKAGYTYKGPMGLSAKVADEYLNTADYATSELTKRNKRWNNTAAIAGEYAPEGGNFFGGLDASQSTDKYLMHPDVSNGGTDLPALLNRYTDTEGLSGGWQMAPKTRVYGAWHLQQIHYTVHQPAPTKDSHSHLVDFGIKGDIAPKLTGQIQTGLVYRHYDEPAVIGTQKTTQISRNWSIATNLTYLPIERTKVNLGLLRALQEATFDVNRFYIQNSVSLNVTHKLPYKLTAGLNLSANIDKYPEGLSAGTAAAGGFTANPRPRRDDTYQQGVNVKYDVQEWLNTGLAYTHRQRFSVYSQQFNYDDHQVMWNFGVTF